VYDWEATIIEALNKADPLWRDRYDTHEAAGWDLLPALMREIEGDPLDFDDDDEYRYGNDYD